MMLTSAEARLFDPHDDELERDPEWTWVPYQDGSGGRWTNLEIRAVFESMTPLERRELMKELRDE